MSRSSKTKAARKANKPIELAPITSIPLDCLVLSPANVRKIYSEASIATLADSIARRSLLQSLSVRAVLGDDGTETGMFEVQAGGRRLRALQLLVTQKRLAPDALIACVVKSSGIAEDDSLAENNDREHLHPVDQFRAFAALRDRNIPEEDIAASYGVTPAVVRQRLRLAAASPIILDAYIAEDMTLEHLMAFCITDDHARQEQLWEAMESGQAATSAHAIRRALTETSVRGDDPRALFVGADAYVEAGGTITRDLFSTENTAYFDDAALLTQLATEKLEAARVELLEQGWQWAEAALDLPYNAAFGMRRLDPLEVRLTKKEQKELNTLQAEHDRLNEQEEQDEQTDARLDELQAAIDAITNRPPVFEKQDMARAGVMIELDGDGSPNIRYGLVKQEDLPKSPDAADSAEENGDWDDTDDADITSQAEADPQNTSLPERLVQDLTAYRTMALRDAMARDFDTAFLAALHALAVRSFYRYGASTCLQLAIRQNFPDQAPGLSDMACAQAVAQRHEQWQGKLPEDASWLWQALITLPQHERADLFAHCTSLTINAVREPHRRDSERLRHADQLASMLQLDVKQAGFTPTVENYFGRITKARIIEDVTAAKGEQTARLIEHLKKPDMASEAQRLIADTDWLPQLLITAELAEPASPQADANDQPLVQDKAA